MRAPLKKTEFTASCDAYILPQFKFIHNRMSSIASTLLTSQPNSPGNPRRSNTLLIGKLHIRPRFCGLGAKIPVSSEPESDVQLTTEYGGKSEFPRGGSTDCYSLGLSNP